jgi:antitoxin component YwqK of YwqJK toxin-antitoxin module
MPGKKSSLTLLFLLAVAVGQASAQPYVVVGQCRYGLPNGAYELRIPDGCLRVVGAFAQGRMTGTFIFWTASGARIAVVPLDNDARNGTLALWYTNPQKGSEVGHKLEAPYVDDQLHGVKRSWYADGAQRGAFHYERGVLVEAHAWTEAGAPLPDADAHHLARADADADEQDYAALLAVIRENQPVCEPAPPNGQPPRS